MRLPRILQRRPGRREASAPLTPELLGEIRRSFDEASGDEEHFPPTIDPRIQHVQAILKYFGALDGARVLDAGCGKGRFARALLASHPRARICGMDISENMLRFGPPEVMAAAGSLTELPYADSAFDFVYATESLEHAVEIERAVGELCRVLKPGGKLVIIDKNAEHWGRLATPAWEKWFDRRTMEKLLAKHCATVQSDYISYWEDVKPDGLFLIWMARK